MPELRNEFDRPQNRAGDQMRKEQDITGTVVGRDAAGKRADYARLAVLTASREVAQATMTLRRMRYLKVREEGRLADAEHAIISADSTEAKEAAKAAKANSKAKIVELEAQLAPAEAELQPKVNAFAAAREAAAAAEAVRAEAAEAANALARALEPVSVFISHETQRLYVRQAFEPILDIPVTFRDPDHRLARTSSRPWSGADERETWFGVLFRWLDVRPSTQPRCRRRHTKRLMPPPTKRMN
jgi:hypothetical protein